MVTKLWSRLEGIEQIAVVGMILQSILLFTANSVSTQRSVFVDAFIVTCIVLIIFPIRRALDTLSKEEATSERPRRESSADQGNRTLN